MDAELKIYNTEFKAKEVYEIPNVEIFRSGNWKGDDYTDSDLDEMVNSFNEVGGVIKPYLKLGHDKGQALIQKDGMPAAGWITGLKREGSKLLATFSNVPKVIKELIEKKAYGRISSEIYWNANIENKKYPKALKAVALLGADTPAVKGLDDFINLYSENNEIESEDVKIIEEDNEMSDTIDIKKFTDEIAVLEGEKVEFNKTISGLEVQVKELTEKIETADLNEKKAFLAEAVKDNKISPVQEKAYTELIKSDFDSVKTIIENTKPIEALNDLESEHTEEVKEKKFSEMSFDEQVEKQDSLAHELIKANKELNYSEAMELALEQLEV